MEIKDEETVARIISNENIVSKLEMFNEHVNEKLNDTCNVHLMPTEDCIVFGIPDDYLISEAIGSYIRYLEWKKQKDDS